jgi:hypothetical protein
MTFGDNVWLGCRAIGSFKPHGGVAGAYEMPIIWIAEPQAVGGKYLIVLPRFPVNGIIWQRVIDSAFSYEQTQAFGS